MTDYVTCENCYDEVTKVTKCSGMMVCKECKTDMTSSEVGVLDNLDDLMGVASDEDIINQYADVAMNNSYNEW